MTLKKSKMEKITFRSSKRALRNGNANNLQYCLEEATMCLL